MTHDYKAVLDSPMPVEDNAWQWLCTHYKPIRAALELADRMQWRPIETAPRDGTCILTLNGNGGGYNGSCGYGTEVGDIAVAYYGHKLNGRFEWMLPHCCDGVSYNQPTHWMPLPEEDQQ